MSEPAGKKWRLIQLPMQISRTSSSMSITSRRSGSSSTPGSKQQSFSNLYHKDKEKGVVETCAPIENVVTSGSNNGSAPHRLKGELYRHYSDSPPNIGSLNLNERHKKRTSALRELTHASSAPGTTEVPEVSGKAYETHLKNPRAWSPVRSVGSMVGTEAHPESDSTVFDADSTHHGSDAFLDDDDHAGKFLLTHMHLVTLSSAESTYILIS